MTSFAAWEPRYGLEFFLNDNLFKMITLRSVLVEKSETPFVKLSITIKI